MSSKNELTLFFLISLFFFLFIPPFFPSLKILFFAPFIVRSFYLRPRLKVLWLCFWCGLLFDLFTSSHRLGIMSCNYMITAFFLYNLKKNFFEDNFTTIPFVTYLFSLVSTIIHIAFLLTFDKNLHLSLKFVLTDLLVMPGVDMLYSALIFALPRYLLSKPSRAGSDYFAS